MDTCKKCIFHNGYRCEKGLTLKKKQKQCNHLVENDTDKFFFNHFVNFVLKSEYIMSMKTFEKYCIENKLDQETFFWLLLSMKYITQYGKTVIITEKAYKDFIEIEYRLMLTAL